VTTLPSHAGDGAAKSVLAVARQGIAADCQGAVVDRQGAATDCQHTDDGRQGATIDHQGSITSHQGVIVDRQGAAADRQGVIPGHQDVADLAASRLKKALAMRCVDGGGHRSRCMDHHVVPTVGANCHGL
jgi:hypothetical protein